MIKWLRIGLLLALAVAAASMLVWPTISPEAREPEQQKEPENSGSPTQAMFDSFKDVGVGSSQSVLLTPTEFKSWSTALATLRGESRRRVAILRRLGHSSPAQAYELLRQASACVRDETPTEETIEIVRALAYLAPHDSRATHELECITSWWPHPDNEVVQRASAVALRQLEGMRTATSERAAHLLATREVKLLVASLGSEFAAVRIWAAESLGKLNDEAIPAIPFLLDRLTDDELQAGLDDVAHSVGDSATSALAMIGKPALEPARERLHQGLPDMRAAAARLIGRIGGCRALDPLIAVLEDPRPMVREAAVDGLRSLRAAAALEPLMQLARRDTDENVLDRIPWALDALEGDQMEEIISLARAEKHVLRASAALLLGQRPNDPRVVDPLLEIIERDEAAVLGVATSAFRIIRKYRGADPLVRILETKEYDPRLRRWALWALRDVPNEADLAVASLFEVDRELRLLAAERLSELKPTERVEEVFTALERLEGQQYLNTVRKLAPFLGAAKDPRATLPLVESLFDHAARLGPFWRQRQPVLEALRALSDPRAIDPLRVRLDDPSRTVRLVAIQGLIQIDHPRIAEIFRLAQDDPESSLATELFATVDNTDGPSSSNYILRYLDHPLPEVRIATIRAVRFDKQSVVSGALRTALRDSEQKVCRAAAECLHLREKLGIDAAP